MSEQNLPKGEKITEGLQGVDLAPGEENAPESEVSGHAAPAYICWNCLATNWVLPGIRVFICWNCGAANRVY
jgi:hypothetical protein